VTTDSRPSGENDLPVGHAVLYPLPQLESPRLVMEKTMSARPHSQEALIQRVHQQMGAFFEPHLEKLGLGAEQIANQSLTELEASLDRVDEAIRNPEQFGVMNLTVTAETAFVVTASAKSMFRVGILPILLERKSLITGRIGKLGGVYLGSNRDSEVRGLIKAELDRQLGGKDIGKLTIGDLGSFTVARRS
jgi:hypothetical protein